MAAFEDLFVGGFEEAVGHFVAVAVRLGQIHQIYLILCVAVAVHGSEARDNLREGRKRESRHVNCFYGTVCHPVYDATSTLVNIKRPCHLAFSKNHIPPIFLRFIISGRTPPSPPQNETTVIRTHALCASRQVQMSMVPLMGRVQSVSLSVFTDQ